MALPTLTKDVNKVSLGAVKVAIAPLDTAPPTISGSDVTWGGAWIDLPYMTNAGVTAAFFIESREVEAFMEDAPIIEAILKSGAREVTMSLLQSDGESLQLAFPGVDTIDTSPPGDFQGWLSHGNLDDPQQFMFGVETRTGVWIFPKVQPQGEPSVSFSDENDTVLELTFRCVTDDDGKTWYHQDVETT